MSLTIFMNNSHSEVRIVTWFRDPRAAIDYATGPVVGMSADAFRQTGHAFVVRHFKDYLSRRLPEDQVVKVFGVGEARKVMKDSCAIEISLDDATGHWWIDPKRIVRFSLADLETCEGENRQKLPPSRLRLGA